MSLVLFRLGEFVVRHRKSVAACWVLALVLLAFGAVRLGSAYDDNFSIPGTESQQGQTIIQNRFGQKGASAQIIFIAASGRVDDSANTAAVKSISDKIDAVANVSFADPLAGPNPVISKDGTSLLATIQFSDQKPSAQTLSAVTDAAKATTDQHLTVSVGGNAYSSKLGGSSGSRRGELIGIAVACVIMLITFGSLIVAGMPLLTALVAVVLSTCSIMLASHSMSVASSAPTLAEMLGLAVGIDYSLFILSRHRNQLAQHMTPAESIPHALATAGGSVVFAGTTVVIALCGLSVVNIPLLTQIALSAAVAVVISVCAALTLLPAVAALLGTHLRPRRKVSRRGVASRMSRSFFSGWFTVVTKIPALTIVIVVAALGSLALPILGIQLSLPDNSTATPGSQQRTTYDLISRHFSAGYNNPISLTADILSSANPKQTVDNLQTSVEHIEGVQAVTLATPNAQADAALLQIIPYQGQTDPLTAALIQRIRGDAPQLEHGAGVSNVMVTGQTSINIDVSARLGQALVPFAAIVVGLSIILLAAVFRSVLVPVKAAIGYLLSVGAALGLVTLVFQQGKGLAAFSSLQPGPVVSFLPIFVMGVLFGLAMDYEMFLVSRMREHYVKGSGPLTAVKEGFLASAPIVCAAALIMISVFTAFIPGGSSIVQPVAFALAVGVFADAFIVRMTLVPAVMALLRQAAWRLPKWLNTVLPNIDIEGAAIETLDERTGIATPPSIAVFAHDVILKSGAPLADIHLAAGAITMVTVHMQADAIGLSQAVCGTANIRGELSTAGFLLPQEAAKVQRATLSVDASAPAQGGTPSALAQTCAQSCLTAARQSQRAAIVRFSVSARDAIAMPVRMLELCDEATRQIRGKRGISLLLIAVQDDDATSTTTTVAIADTMPDMKRNHDE